MNFDQQTGALHAICILSSVLTLICVVELNSSSIARIVTDRLCSGRIWVVGGGSFCINCKKYSNSKVYCQCVFFSWDGIGVWGNGQAGLCMVRCMVMMWWEGINLGSSMSRSLCLCSISKCLCSMSKCLCSMSKCLC